MSPEREFDPQIFRSLAESGSLEISISDKEAKLTVSLLEKCRPYMKEEDLEEVILAEEMMSFALAGEKRKSGDPASTHSLEAAHILADAFISEGAKEVDKEIIIAGLLHDLPEDTGGYPDEKKEKNVTVAHIRSLFGEAVANMVDAATRLKGKKNIDLSFRTHLKIFESLLSDPRVIFVKLADRLHNMRTIEYLERKDQIRKAKETLKVYVPLALKLNLDQWANELADLSLKVLYGRKQSYQKLERRCEELFPEDKLGILSGVLKLILGEAAMSVYLEKPSLYPLYRKFGKNFLGIADEQFAARLTIVVNEPKMPEELVARQPFLVQKYLEAQVKAQILRCFAIIDSTLSRFPSGSAERLRETLELGEVAGFPLTIDDLPMEVRFIDKETQVKEQASLFDFYLKEPEDPLHDYAEEKLEKLQHNLERVEMTGGVRIVAKEFTDNLDTELITVASEDGREYVFPRGRATVLDAVYAFRTDLGRNAVFATIERDGHGFVDVPLFTLLAEGDRIRVKKDPEAEVVRDPFRLDWVLTPYAKKKERRNQREIVDEEKNLPYEERIATSGAIDRGIAIINELFTLKAKERGFRYPKLIVRIDHVLSLFADHHQRMKLAGQPEEDLLADFLTHVGLDEIRMEGKGGEILTKVVDALVEYQFSLVPIHLVVEDIPGVIGEIGKLFARSEINIESMDDVAYQKKTGLHLITILIAPDKLEIFEKEVRGRLETAFIKIGRQEKKVVHQVIVHESGLQVLDQEE